jgi:cytidyltransferase-like protein
MDSGEVFMNVITLGSFDLFHFGHMELLKRCKAIAGTGTVIVGLNSDAFYEKYRRVAPIMTYQERKQSILSSGLADVVVENDQDTKSVLDLVLQVGAEMIVIGSDWSPWGEKKKDYLNQLAITQNELDEHQISLCFVPYTRTISSSELKQRMR